MPRPFRSLALLLGLRYRLLWAQARLRPGKTVLYCLGFLLLVSAAAWAHLGGLGGAGALVRSGRAEQAAGALLGLCYASAVLAAVLLGYGMNAVFADAVLRRYPLRRLERFAARQAISILEPLWLLVGILYLGFAAGFLTAGTASPWAAFPAAALLAAGNYLLARVLATVLDRVLAAKHGPQALLAAMMFLFMIPALLVRPGWGSAAAAGIAGGLRYAPPAAAAAVFAGGAPAAGLLVLLAWAAALGAAVFQLDRPPGARAAGGGEGAAEATGGLYGMAAALFRGSMAPLAGKFLRYYVRSPQLRFNYMAAVVFIVPFNLLLGGRADAARSLSLAIGYVLIAGYLSTGAMASNAFGFDGAGFRRYFLLPVAARSVLRAAAAVPLLLGAAVIPASVALWSAFTPAPVDGRTLLLLLSSGFAGLLLFQSLALWVSLLSPRAVPFKITFGNRMSLGANMLMILAVACINLPAVFDHVGMPALLDRWWVAPMAMVPAGAFYAATLHAGAAFLSGRRERMLAVIERGC